MGSTIASEANGNIALAPSDSAAETAKQVAFYTNSARPADVRTLWANAFYYNVDVPLGGSYSEYILRGGGLIKKANLPTLENMKTWFRRYHDYLASLSARLEGEEAKLWQWDFLKKAHDWIAWLHHGANVVGARRTSVLESLTIAQRIRWCHQALLGPTDIRTIASVEGKVHKVYEILSDSNHNSPIAPVVYVDPRGVPADVLLNDAVMLSNTLGISAVTDFTGKYSVDVNGSWIDNLTE